MKLFKAKQISIILILVLILGLTACTNSNDTNNEDNSGDSTDNQNKSIEEIAVSFVKDLINGEYDTAYNDYEFDSKMKEAVNPSSLQAAIDQLKGSLGDFVKIVDKTQTSQDGYEIISVTCEFENDYMNLNVVFDQDSKIVGFNFSNVEDFSKTAEEMPDNIEEQEVIVGEGKWQLPGTLAVPKGQGTFPAVVLVHGSGPNDRDETVGPNKPFRDIAWGLAEKGIAVLRYEKRTKEHAQKVVDVIDEFTVEDETIDDALLAVDLLKSNDKIDNDRIYVLGHSLGGYLVPRIATQDEDISGFVILAGPTRHLEDLMVEQIEYLSSLDGNITDEEQAQIDAAKNAREKIKDPNLDLDTNFNELFGGNPKYWIDLRNYDPAKLAKELDRPILIMQGKRDYQVTMEDFNNWKEELQDKNNVIFKTYDKLNHLFMAGEGDPNPTEYGIKGKVSQDAIDDIAIFINGKK
ncbi:DUF3887 domain-containing protein [Sporosalibacterium faouarense]|uniref:DUF3887 domain-containing protein n=1 Tax=Sporosalibacterium faouarense TaxID=516123 RepID=UPI00192B4CE2|nr:DUF3887 domain-containing protein [Sporosalibacterium faouarense]